MARYTGAVCRLCRREGQKLFLKGDRCYTDRPTDPDEVVMISKDTAYVDENGEIVRQTIERPLTSLYDFLNTYIVRVYPDTTCWVNDFPNANNEPYMKLYFSSAVYNDYPVVGVTWEQAQAFCAWRTEYLLKGMGPPRESGNKGRDVTL